MLRDASGEERKGIGIDLLQHFEEEHIPVWYCVPGVECQLIADDVPTLGFTLGEEKTIRDLMLAGV